MNGTSNGTTGDPGRQANLGGRRALVVVGIDGSAPSRAALRFALEDARRRGARVRMVWAYDPAEQWSDSGTLVPLNSEATVARLRVEAWQLVADAVRADPALNSVPIESRFLPGPAAGVLVAASHHADLLVIGHRGRGGLASALLGAVGLHCALRAACPVVIARPDVPAASLADEARAATEVGR